MAKTLDTLLLVALPGAGKSEVRTYLSHLPPDVCARDFRLGPLVQLDDFPYLHLMRRVDEALAQVGGRGLFFSGLGEPFLDGRDWGTLVKLLNEDYEDLKTRRMTQPASAAGWLLNRLDAARARVGLPAACNHLATDLRRRVCDHLEREARTLLRHKQETYPVTLTGKTVVIELARGGRERPLSAPFGYGYSLARFSPEILERAAVLYIHVPPSEATRRMQSRALTSEGVAGSALPYGVPPAVMRTDFAVDDMQDLMAQSDRPGTLKVQTHGRTYHLPMTCFDNADDKTAFVRDGEPATWPRAATQTLHAALAQACEGLGRQRGA